MKRTTPRAGRHPKCAAGAPAHERSPRGTGRGTPVPPPKRPFDIHQAIPLLREAVKPFPPAAMFALRDAGYGSLFQQLVACIISIRTRDETSLPVSLRLLAQAPTPEAMLKLTPGQIDELIHESTFHEPKARTIRTIARVAVEAHAGELPCERELLLALPGVGPKCASLALGIGCDQPHISVDVHVHRVVNRWGWLGAPVASPEKMMLALMKVLPDEYWIELNGLLVPFGKHHCTASAPKCSSCPLLRMCQQRGVKNPR